MKSAYTIGTWDLLHYGHLRMIHKAGANRALVIGVCSDELSLKTKGRLPAVPERARLAFMKELVEMTGFVRDAFIYKRLSQVRILEELQPDILVVGEEYGDFTEHQETLAYCKRNDIAVQVLERTDGISSTVIRDNIMPPSNPTPQVTAFDLHDTITAAPEYFKDLIQRMEPKRVFIMTGTPKSKKLETLRLLYDMGIVPAMFNELLMGFEYDKDNMDHTHFLKMREHKLKLVKKYGIEVVYDDNPYYCDFLRQNGVTVFQPVLSEGYMALCKTRDNYFTGHLQKGMYNYLENYLVK